MRAGPSSYADAAHAHDLAIVRRRRYTRPLLSSFPPSETMRRIYLPAESPDQWRAFLAQPDLHWKAGRSAHALAHAWQAAAGAPDGFPPEVRAALAQAPALAAAEVLLVLPEHETPLPGGRAASQTDALVLARTPEALVVIGVEGKVVETFGPTVAEWEVGASDGKRERLAFLLATLGLPSVPSEIRYQLLHRTAAALLEANRFRAQHAVVLVHSFDTGQTGFDDFRRFASLLGADVQAGGVATAAARAGGAVLHFAWVTGAPSGATGA